MLVRTGQSQRECLPPPLFSPLLIIWISEYANSRGLALFRPVFCANLINHVSGKNFSGSIAGGQDLSWFNAFPICLHSGQRDADYAHWGTVKNRAPPSQFVGPFICLHVSVCRPDFSTRFCTAPSAWRMSHWELELTVSWNNYITLISLIMLHPADRPSVF